MQQYQNEFNMQLQEYQINQNERQVQMKELGFALDLMNFETNDQKQEREWNYWVRQQEYQNWNINSKDYQTRYKAALKSVQNLLSQYEWIPMERSAEQMAQDVLKAIDNGSDLGTELTKINKLIQGKPEYKTLYNATFGTSSQGFGKTVNIGGTDYVEYNWQLYTAEDFNKKFWNAISVSPEVMSQWLETFKTKMQSLVATWWAIRKWWCGEPVNDYLKSIWSNVQYDNDLQTKLDSITPWAWPKVWSIAIWDWSSFNSPDAKKHGHVAIVTWVDEKNWTITVLESNWQAHKMGMGYWKYNMANVTWYFDPSAWYSASSSNSNWTTTDATKTTITDSDIISFNDKTLNRKLSDEDRQRIADARNKVYSDPNASIEDILRFSQWWDSVTDATVQSFDKYGQALTSLWQLTDLLEDTNTWPILWALRSKNPYDKKAREIETAIAWLLPTLARWVYGEVGVLTDKDIEHYSKTVPNLKSTSDVNEAVLAMSLDMLASGYKRKLQNQAALGKDVSGMAWVYYQIVNESNRIKKKIWIDTWNTSQSIRYWKSFSNRANTASSANTSPTAWTDWLNKSSDVFKLSTNIWWFKAPANFY